MHVTVVLLSVKNTRLLTTATVEDESFTRGVARVQSLQTELGSRNCIKQIPGTNDSQQKEAVHEVCKE